MKCSWIFLPDFFPKYTAKLVESGFIDASVKIVGKDDSIGEHYYFRGEIVKDYAVCSFNDYDNSGSSRIFLITVSHDSLLLHCVDPVRKKDFEFRDRYIAEVIPKNEIYDFQIQQPLFSDLDGDGNSEYITTIMSGFPLKPRIVLSPADRF
ncbi:MAG: hypothetical protein ABIJ04_02815 [Bacteroidota bacterium]